MMKTAMLCAYLSALVLGAAGKARPADHFGEPALAEYFEDGYDGPWIQREMSPRLVGHGGSGAIPEDEEDETSNRRSLLLGRPLHKYGSAKKTAGRIQTAVGAAAVVAGAHTNNDALTAAGVNSVSNGIENRITGGAIERATTIGRRGLLRHKTKGKKGWGHGKKGKWGGKKGWGHGKKHHGKKWGKKWGKQYRG